jgi:mono/diheme cytochrome c family protein
MEALARTKRFKNVNANAGFILALAVGGSIFSVVCGLLLEQGGGYDANLLSWHKWTAIAMTAICLAAALLYRFELHKPYRWSLSLGLVLLVVASHFGGSLTHGRDYLVEHAPRPIRNLLGAADKTAATPATHVAGYSDLPAYTAVIHPILDRHCVGCHGPEKSKGGLRLDSHPSLLKGSKGGPVLTAGKAADSVLTKLLHLPIEDENHMPPEGKPQPSPDDLALLEWWIDAGAPAEAKVADLKPPAAIVQILESRFKAAPTPAPVAALAPKPRAEMLSAALQVAADLGIAITPLSETDPWLQANASIAGPDFGDAELAKMAPLAANLRWLDLSGTKITDAALCLVATMQNLERLHLQRTAITDAGLKSIQPLANLHYLNLYGTAISDDGLAALRSLPNLKQVYLWQTKVTPDGVKEFAGARTDASQLKRWQEEIEALQAKIRDQKILIETGAPASTAKSEGPMNTLCPVTNKPIDPTKTAQFEGHLVAFCCKDCKAGFEKDPAACLPRLGIASTNTPSTKSQP